MPNWSFDPLTALFTAVALPILLFGAKLLVRHLKEWTEFLLEAVLSNFGRIFKRSVVARFSMKRYCRLQIASQNQYLIVPSAQDFALHI
ncbi:MAG TPA: hypothetical protein VF179_32010, partial [Thermoanaerobaculia bacterium]|nr:hypothetical protein [Thermoanaerobaculia bacterium]